MTEVSHRWRWRWHAALMSMPGGPEQNSTQVTSGGGRRGAEAREEHFGADGFLLLSGETCGFPGMGKAGKWLWVAGAAEVDGFALVGWDGEAGHRPLLSFSSGPLICRAKAKPFLERWALALREHRSVWQGLLGCLMN